MNAVRPASPALFRRPRLHAVLFVAVALVLETTSLDLWWADQLFRWSGQAWSWRDAWLTSTLIHEGGRSLVGLLVLVLLLLLAGSWVFAALRPWRKGLLYLAASTLAAGLLINVLKQLTHVDCPWDLLRYGGSQPYVRNFAPLPAGLEAGACFPAGHASAGWAWLGLYFWAREHAWAWRRHILVAVVLLGLVFGLGQQLRGAHFLSHDVWTLGLCWGVSALLYGSFYGRAGLAAIRSSPAQAEP